MLYFRRELRSPGDAVDDAAVAFASPSPVICELLHDVVGIALTSSDLISPAQKSTLELPRRAAARQRVVIKKRE
jgi:hypothetical protein